MAFHIQKNFLGTRFAHTFLTMRPSTHREERLLKFKPKPWQKLDFQPRNHKVTKPKRTRCGALKVHCVYEEQPPCSHCNKTFCKDFMCKKRLRLITNFNGILSFLSTHPEECYRSDLFYGCYATAKADVKRLCTDKKLVWAAATEIGALSLEDKVWSIKLKSNPKREERSYYTPTLLERHFVRKVLKERLFPLSLTRRHIRRAPV